MKTTTAIFLGCLMILALACGVLEGPGTTGSIQIAEFPKTGIPVVNIQVLVKSGSADDPVGKEGLAQFTASLMMRSTEKFNREEIDNTLQMLGARLDITVDRETILFSCQTLKEKLDQTYQILSEILLHPTFPQSEAEKVKSEQLDDIEDIIRDDSRLCLAVFQSTLYDGHRFAHPVPGLKAAVSSFSSEDADLFYRSNFRSGNVILGIAGDYLDDFAGKMMSDFETLSSRSVRHTGGDATPVSGRRVVLVEKENRAQTHFRIGNIATYNRSTPEYYPLLVANTYLGQHRESFGRLYQTIRTERGLAYGAYSYHEHFRQSGWSKLPRALIPWNPTYHSIWTYPKAVNAEFAMKLALLEYSKLVEGGIEPRNLEKMRQFTVNHFPFMYETPAKRLSLEMEQIYYNDSTYIPDYAERVSEVTSATVADAVGEHWSVDSYLLVAVVSDGEQFKAELLDDQTVIEYPSGATNTGLEAVDQQVKQFDLKLTEADIVIVKASDLFE
jgi:zinc protease